MKIWFDSGGLWYDRTGAGVHIRELTRALRAFGHTVRVFAAIEKHIPDGIEIGIFSGKSPFNISSTAVENEVFFLPSFLRNMVRKEELPDVIYRRHSFLGLGAWVGKMLGVPVVTEINGLKEDHISLAGRKLKFLRRLVRLQSCVEYKLSRKIVVVTEKMKEVVAERYNIPLGNIVVVPNGANVRLFKPMDRMEARSELSMKHGSKIICFVGFLTPWNGVDFLIRSAPDVLKEVHDVTFLIVGNGPDFNRLTHIVKDMGLEDHFIFTGEVPYERVPIYINSSDVCVAPFIMRRNERIGLSPLKIFEYLACGRAVVSSSITGVESVIRRSGAGTLVPPESPKDLARALIGLLADNVSREKMERRGRDFVLQECSWELVARRVAAICAQTVDETRRS